MSVEKKGILEKLAEGPVIGDGGFVTAMEKRGYIRAGLWSPEACVEHPDAVRELHREFLRCGADVLQAFTFYAGEDRLEAQGKMTGKVFDGQTINENATRIVKEVASGGGALTAGSITRCTSYAEKKGKDAVQEEFRKQFKVFVEFGLDFVILEFFDYVEEIVWGIEACKEFGLPIAATMTIGVEGDHAGVSAADCAVKMAQAGARIVGVNCYFDPSMSLKALKLMKDGLQAANLLDKPTYLMCQPLGYHDPDAGKDGYDRLPEFPFALEPRICTRWDIHKYAREAHELGVRYIGGCCGFEPYHIRAISEELSAERGGKIAPASEKHDPWGAGLSMHGKHWVRNRVGKEYWSTLVPATGRPESKPLSQPDP